MRERIGVEADAEEAAAPLPCGSSFSLKVTSSPHRPRRARPPGGRRPRREAAASSRRTNSLVATRKVHDGGLAPCGSGGGRFAEHALDLAGRRRATGRDEDAFAELALDGRAEEGVVGAAEGEYVGAGAGERGARYACSRRARFARRRGRRLRRARRGRAPRWCHGDLGAVAIDEGGELMAAGGAGGDEQGDAVGDGALGRGLEGRLDADERHVERLSRRWAMAALVAVLQATTMSFASRSRSSRVMSRRGRGSSDAGRGP